MTGVKFILKLRIQNEVDVILCQKRSKELCAYTGMNLAMQTKFSTAVSEMCRNVYEHVGEGSLHFNIVSTKESQFLEAQIIDYGRGIYEVESLLNRRVVEGSKKGNGLVSAKRLVNYFEIYSEPDKGTKVLLRNTISPKMTITSAMIQGWNQHFSDNQNISAYEELKNRNNELIELTEALQHQNNETKLQLLEITRLNKELDQFTYIASHDLKAPLKNIIGLSEMLEENLGDNDITEATSVCLIIKEQALAMDKLIVDILSYSKIGRQNIQKTKIEGAQLLENVLKSLHVPKSFTFHIEPLPVLLTEEVLLFQVFSNLISNAIKHNDKTKGIITIGSKQEDQKLLFYVKDNGPGISPLGMKKIFELFESIHVHHENTGIGLSIVKTIVNAKNSRIWVDSDGKNGCQFNFTWPLEDVVA